MGMINYERGRKARYRQIDKAWKLERQPVDVTIPYYDKKKEVWCLGAGEDRREDVYLDRLVQDFAGYEMKFRYTWNGDTVTRRIFAEVLEDMVTRYEDLSITGFEEDYNNQQIEWMRLIRNKMMELKGQKGEKS